MGTSSLERRLESRSGVSGLTPVGLIQATWADVTYVNYRPRSFTPTASTPDKGGLIVGRACFRALPCLCCRQHVR